FKYRGQRHLAAPLAVLAARVVPKDVDLVVPVPLHPIRLRERGFNQSQLLAEELGGTLGLLLETTALARRRHTPSQTGLSQTQRLANVRGAFVAPRRLNAVHALLV